MTTTSKVAADKPTEFEQALELYQQGQSALGIASESGPSNAEDVAYATMIEGERRLFNTKAKNLSEFRAKFEVAYRDPQSLLPEREVNSLFIDLRNLTSNEASRTFQADLWVDWFQEYGGGWIERDGEITLLYPESLLGSSTQWELESRNALPLVRAEIRKRLADHGPDSPPTWGQLVQTYHRTKAAIDAHCAKRDKSDFGSPENESYEATTDRLSDDHARAIDALFDFASPDVAALKFKIALYASEQLEGWHRANDFAKIIAKESERLI